MTTPLVLLHGLNMSNRAWSPVQPFLTSTHTVFAPTLAGHRGGPTLPDGWSGVATIVDQVERDLDRRGWDRAHLVGNSLGGWLAFELAQRGRALSVVAFSPAGAAHGPFAVRRLSMLLRSLQATSRWRLTERLITGESTRSLALGMLMENAEALTDDQIAGLLRDARACDVLDGLLAWITDNGPLRAFDLPPGLPVRLAWPRRDRLIPWRSYGMAFHAIAPTAEVTFLDGVGHVPMFDDPRLVASTILDCTSPTGHNRTGSASARADVTSAALRARAG